MEKNKEDEATLQVQQCTLRTSKESQKNNRQQQWRAVEREHGQHSKGVYGKSNRKTDRSKNHIYILTRLNLDDGLSIQVYLIGKFYAAKISIPKSQQSERSAALNSRQGQSVGKSRRPRLRGSYGAHECGSICSIGRGVIYGSPAAEGRKKLQINDSN